MARQQIPLRRRRAREIALQLVYELDMRPALTAEEAIEMYPFDGEEADAASYATSVVSSVREHIDEIDSMIRENAVGWREERMLAVDRAAIKIALCEAYFLKSVPIAVAISEAVELTKMFGTEGSGKFVNGVLGRIVRSGEGSDGEADD